MKFFNKERNTKPFRPKYTVGSLLRDGQEYLTEKEKVLQQIEDSIKMSKDGLGKIFSPLSGDDLKSLEKI